MYEKAQVAPAASVTPAQFCTAPKLASPLAPPATDSTFGDVEMFVTTTSMAADVSSTAVLGNVSVVGEMENVGVAVPDKDVTAGAVSLRGHTHTGVQPGNGTTGTPVGG